MIHLGGTLDASGKSIDQFECIHYQWNEIKMAEHLAKASQVPAELLYFNGCSINQQVYAVCSSGITCPALREEANTKNMRLILAPALLRLDQMGTTLLYLH